MGEKNNIAFKGLAGMAYSLKSVFKGSMVYSVGQVLTKGAAFLLIPIYTHFLSTAEYGIVGYTNVFQQLLSTVFSFGLFGAQVRYYYDLKTKENELKKFLFTQNSFLILVFAFILPLILLFSSELSTLSPAAIPFYPYIFETILISVFSVMNQMVISYELGRKKFLLNAVMQISLFVAITLFTVLLLAIGGKKADGYLDGMLYGNILFFIIFFPIYAKKFQCHFSFPYLKMGLVYGLPTVFHLVGGIINQSVGRLILEKYVSLSELGVYTLGYQISMVMILIASSINQAWQPNYYELMLEKKGNREKKMRQYFYLYFLFISVFTMFFVLYLDDLLVFFVPPTYLQATSIMKIILMAYLVYSLYYFFSSPIFYYKKTKILPLITLSTASINIVLCYLFIPSKGILGAAIATFISLLLQTVIVYIYSLTLHKTGISTWRIIIITVFLFMGFPLSSIFIQGPINRIRVIFLIAIPVVFLLIFPEFRDFIRSIFVKKLPSR